MAQSNMYTKLYMLLLFFIFTKIENDAGYYIYGISPTAKIIFR
jgi:hypothetical protein